MKLNSHSDRVPALNNKLKMQIIIELMCQESNIQIISNQYDVSLSTLTSWKREFMLEINQNIRI